MDSQRVTAGDVIRNLLQSHRSIRQYKRTDLPWERLDEIIAAAIQGTSSSGNLGSFSLILTRDVTKREALHRLHFDQDMILQAPACLTVCADFHRARTWLSQRDAADNFDNFMGFLVAAADALLVAQSIALACEAEGWGICYMGTTLHSMAGISELLELPVNVVPLTTLVIGYPDETPSQRERLPLEAFLHRESYKRFTKEDIDAIYRASESSWRERYESEYPELLDAIERLGVHNAAQFYTCPLKYQRETYQQSSRDILELLDAKEFFRQ